MRALCGAIITAGALIGLGLAALGFGTRYHGVLADLDSQGHIQQIPWGQIDRPLILILVVLILAALVGFGIAFLGLAYHHHRRHHELLHHHHHPEGITERPAV
jgi:hypothetical protein